MLNKLLLILTLKCISTTAIFTVQNIELKGTMSSMDDLKYQYWSTNYGINISDINPLVKEALLEINDEIIEQTLQVIEKYRVKNPTESLFQFKKDNATGSYYVSQHTPIIKVSEAVDIRFNTYEKPNFTNNKMTKITRKQDLKLLVIQTRNIISKQITSINFIVRVVLIA